MFASTRWSSTVWTRTNSPTVWNRCTFHNREKILWTTRTTGCHWPSWSRMLPLRVHQSICLSTNRRLIWLFLCCVIWPSFVNSSFRKWNTTKYLACQALWLLNWTKSSCAAIQWVMEKCQHQQRLLLLVHTLPWQPCPKMNWNSSKNCQELCRKSMNSNRWAKNKPSNSTWVWTKRKVEAAVSIATAVQQEMCKFQISTRALSIIRAASNRIQLQNRWATMLNVLWS